MTNGHRMDTTNIKKHLNFNHSQVFKWRRRWDSNPRYAINVRQFSRLLQSTALALLQRVYPFDWTYYILIKKISIVKCIKKFEYFSGRAVFRREAAKLKVPQ